MKGFEYKWCQLLLDSPYRNFSSVHSYLTESDEALCAENLYGCVSKTDR